MGEAALAWLGAKGLEILVDASTQTATDLLTGAMTGLVDGVADFLSKVEGFPDWVEDGLNTFAGNLSDEIVGLGDQVLDEAGEYAKDVLDVTETQNDALATIQKGLDDTFGTITTTLGLNLEQEHKTGAAMTDLFFRMAESKGNTMIQMAESWYEMEYGTTMAIQTEDANYAQAMLDELKDYFAADLAYVEGMSNKKAQAWAEAIMAESQQMAEYFHDWFTMTVSMPVSFGRAFEHSIRNAAEVSDEDVKDAMKRAMIMQQEITVEMAEDQSTKPKPPRGFLE